MNTIKLRMSRGLAATLIAIALPSSRTNASLTPHICIKNLRLVSDMRFVLDHANLAPWI